MEKAILYLHITKAKSKLKVFVVVLCSGFELQPI